jgi:hypothetical protein
MSIKWAEHDPYTGVTEINVADEDGDEIRTHRVQDVDPLLSRTAEARNTKSADRPGKDLQLYASVPMVIAYEMLKKGINVFNPDHMPRVLAEINSNYPKLKYTEKTHALGSRRVSDSQKPETSTPPGPALIVR